MSEEEYELQVKLLGREPAKYEDYVVKLAAEWKKWDWLQVSPICLWFATCSSAQRCYEQP